MRNNNQPVALEGYPFIALFAFITLVFALLGWTFLALIFLGLAFFTVYFFRNPERVCPDDEAAIVAPADGKIVFVGEVKEERHLNDEAIKVSIFMNVFNVHINYAPFSGKVLKTFYHHGSFLNASLDKASLQNEQGGILMENDKGVKLLVVQIAGLVARRIVTYPVVGDILKRGMRFGLIRFGSRVDVYFPKGSEIKVRLGDRTVGSETILGYLP